MANTTVQAIPGGNVWTLVSSVSGRINVSDPCFYCKSATLPDKSLQGHRLDDSDALDFTLLGSEQLYVKNADPFRVILSDGGFGFDEWLRLMTKGQKGVIIQNYIEANVKNGLQFYFQHLFTGVAVGETVSFKFQTGAKPVIIKSREIIFTGSSRVDYQAVEGGSYPDGSAVAIGNENRINPVATTVTVAQGGTPSGGVIYRNRAIFGAGATTGGGSRVGTDVFGRDTILKPNTIYTVKLTNVTGNTTDIQVEYSWYEGTPDLP